MAICSTAPGRPSDYFAKPFANDQAARASNGGALPPDLSLIIKAREGHEDYVYSLLTGFGQTPPADETIMKGMNYNPYFPGHQIAMPPPLRDDAVTYADGTPATVRTGSQWMSRWPGWLWAGGAQDGSRGNRTGLKVLIFLIAFAAVMYGVKRKIWSKLH